MNRIVTIALGAAVIAAPVAAARAGALTATYYTILSTNPDANNLAHGTFTNEVGPTLGPDGLPVLNLSQFTGCTTNCYTERGAPGFPNGSTNTTPNVNVNSSGEITYWDPSANTGGNPYVTQTSQTTTTLPFNDLTLFPPNGTGSGDGGSVGFQALTLSGTITAGSTEKLSFSIGSDDMAFAYIDGNLVCSDGGIHGDASVACTTPTISAGNHSFNLFFVDLNTTQSALTFSISTQDVTTAPVPEPAALALLGTGTGILGLGLLRRRA